MTGLVDCNNFYCSCERLFNPALCNRPVVVLSNNDGSVIARSEEAKALGIGMAVAEFKVRDIIRKNNVAVLSSNYELYADMSDRVFRLLAQSVERIEIYSIDEAFIDLAGMTLVAQRDVATIIRKKILQCTGIPVSIGIAKTKTLAKMVSSHGKKTDRRLGVYHESEMHLPSLLKAKPVDDVWGIGAKHAALLKDNGYLTAHDFALAPSDWIRRHLSVVGLRIAAELNGINALAIESPHAKKNISITRSLPHRTNDRSVIEEAIANHAASCAFKLRQQKSMASRLTVFLQTNPFIQRELQHTPCISVCLEPATNDSGEIIHKALKALDLIFLPHYPYQRAGVQLEQLVNEENVQGGLFDAVNRSRSRKIMHTVDDINERLGREIVRFSSQQFGKRYLPQALHLSRRYTTRIEETLEIKI